MFKQHSKLRDTAQSVFAQHAGGSRSFLPHNTEGITLLSKLFLEDLFLVFNYMYKCVSVCVNLNMTRVLRRDHKRRLGSFECSCSRCRPPDVDVRNQTLVP